MLHLTKIRSLNKLRAKRTLLRCLYFSAPKCLISVSVVLTMVLLLQSGGTSQNRWIVAEGAAATNTSPNTSSTTTTANQTTLPAQSSSSSTSQSTHSSSQTPAAKIADTKSTKSSAIGNKQQQQQVTSIEQQPQSTDVSSMYVQIPIAEPADAGMGDDAMRQQTINGDSSDGGDSSSKSSTSWTGPWPKKFQIGYIKQSDLHQVLIESLKNDPFVSLGGTSGQSPSASSAGTKSVSTTPVPSHKISTATAAVQQSSDSSSLMSAGQKSPALVPWAPQQQIQQNVPRVPMVNKNNIYGQIQQQQQQLSSNHNYREPKVLQQQAFQNHRYQQQINFNQQPPSRAQIQYNQQPKMMHFGNQHHHQQQQQHQQNQHQQQQFQFAGFPTNSFKNQPIYTISNSQYPNNDQQPLTDPNAMQILVPPTSGGYNHLSHTTTGENRGPKSDYHYSSWRPVTSDNSNNVPQAKTTMGQNGQFQTDYQTMGDGFDDGFNSPTKQDSSANLAGSMNRHPMLNNYLTGIVSNSDLSNETPKQTAKLSPAMSAKMKLQQQSQSKTQVDSTRSSSTTKGGSTKSSANEPTKTQQAQNTKGSVESGMELSVNRRRSQPAANNATTTSTISTNSSTSDQSTTTVSPSDEGTTASSIATTTTSAGTTAAAGANSTTGSSGTTTLSSTSTDNSEGETQEPDSEVINSDTTEPTNLTPTTTAISINGSSTTLNMEQQQDTKSTSSSTTGTQNAESGESEVVTQGAVQQQSTASLPPISENTPTSSTENSLQRTSPASSSSSTSSVGSTQNSQREETTPASSEQSSTSMSPIETSSSTESSNTKGGEMEEAERTSRSSLDSLSDEALLQASVRNGSTDLAKMSDNQRAKVSTTNNNNNNKKRTRSSERLVQPVAQVSSSSNRKQQITTTPNSSNKLITKRPQQQQQSNRSGKQVSLASENNNNNSVKGSNLKSASLKSANNSKNQLLQTPGNNNKKRLQQTTSGNGKGKAITTRMTAQSERLQQQQQQQQQPQVVSMSAAQAQSTAQSLASILLSRCLSSSNCAHLLDVCTTKQAAIPLQQFASNISNQIGSDSITNNNNNNNNMSAAWSMPVGLMSSNIMSLTQALQADRVLKIFPQWKDAIENLLDHDTQTGYTLILPSNDAIDRLPEASVDSWLANNDLMAQVIDNHMIDSPEVIQLNSDRNAPASQRTRFIRSKNFLQVNQHRDKMVTLNGKRLVYANQAAPSNGRIHVIDGLLDSPLSSSSSFSSQPTKALDIMDTLKQCDKFDGFVTLADGTGLTQILKQDGPMTVFVPSNEALRKIPDEELEVIKNNSTALKEFLMYHVVNGSYFSQDLRDGQQLASILDMRPIQVGVRVDGCSRRLVEANTSPMRRPDIVAKNGVIHILDWYLSVRENEWCEPIGRPSVSTTRNSLTSTSSLSATQDLAASASSSLHKSDISEEEKRIR